MYSNHPYYVKTNNGILEISKGAYLTLMKRKKSEKKTLRKTKKIIHFQSCKKTLKKIYKNSSHETQKHLNSFEFISNVIFQKKVDQSIKEHEFKIYQDRNIFSLQCIPNIQMQRDNDQDSDWPQVDQGVIRMTHCLSMAVLDSFNY